MWVKSSPVLLVPGLLLLAACGATRPASSAAASQPALASPPAAAPSAAIVSVSEQDGRVLAELPLGRTAGLEPGAFLRVYAANDQHRLKGMIKVVEVLGPERAIAQLILLSDRQAPVQVGDQARFIADLADYAAPAAVEASTRTHLAKVDQDQAEQEARFAKLRLNYQQELQAAQTRADQTLAEVHAQYQAQLRAADQASAEQIARLQAERQADLAALKTAVPEQIAAALAEERKASNQRLAALTAENATAQQQVASLLAQQQTQNQRIASLLTQLSEQERVQRQQIQAEIETRAVLQARLKELEARLEGRNSPAVAVLANDPNRSETVLEHLTRLSDELAREKQRASRLDSVLAENQTALTQLQERNAELGRQLAEVAPTHTQAQHAIAELAEVKERLEKSEQARQALELSRLESERTLYELAAQVLRLAGSSPETVALQARLRTVLADHGPGETP